jgi:NADPH-dependent 2,4-dienoyl-CoA reductase/sulfur reductase-like enzyme
VRDELERRGVRVLNNVTVTAIQERNGRPAVIGDDGLDIDAGMALVVVGVRPNARLGRMAGIDTDPRGALRVNLRMQTNLPHIYCAAQEWSLARREATNA